MPSAEPQMISVGAAIRWMRFLRQRSGIGQTNLLVQACDQIKLACTSTRTSLSSGSSKKRCAAFPLGSAKSAGRSLILRHDHPVFDRQVVAPQAERVDQDQLSRAFRHCRGDLAGHHAAEGMAEQSRRFEPKQIQ